MPEVNEAAVEIEEVQAWAAGLEAVHARIAGGSPAPSHADGCWRICVGWLATWAARTAGSWPSTLGSAPRMGCSGCWPPPTGTRTWSATICAAMWSSTWATLVGCWWWTRPGSSRRARPRSGCSASTRARPAGSTTASSAVFLAYASAKGRAFIDRELYLPKAWTEDRARCRAARAPEQVGFRTKPQLARVMLERALEAGVPAAWVTADEVYGQDPALRGWLEGRRMAHVLAIKSSELLAVGDGPAKLSAAQLAAAVPKNRRSTNQRSRYQAPTPGGGPEFESPGPAAASPSGLLPTERWPPRTGSSCGRAGAIVAGEWRHTPGTVR